MIEYQEIFDNFSEGFGCWTPEQRLLQANDAFLRLMGLGIKKPFSELPEANALSHAFSEISGVIMKQVEIQGAIKNFEFRLPHEAGASRWVRVNAWRVLDTDNSSTRCYAAYLADVTNLKLKEAELSHLAFYDALTGLPNRSLFINKLAAALQAAKRYPEQYALISIDLDDLSNINQHYGRDFGDMLLRHVATTLLACCRETDAVARIGSDDFAMLLRDPEGGSGLVKIIKRIRSKLETPFVIWEQQLDSVSAHFGVIFPLNDYDSQESALRDAGLAAGRARTTRNNLACKFFSKRMMEKARKTLSLTVVLRKKHDLKGFHVVYQPIVRPANGDLHSFEALARWAHEGRSVSPSTFIPIAEETGFIKSLGEFIIEATCRQLHCWQDEYNAAINMHVNVSPSQLATSDFPDSINDILHRTGVDSSRLFFEVTESIFLRDFAKVLHNVNLLRQLGIHFCLDDFGTGYSSLSYLKLLPIECLKIDRSFVSDLEKDTTSRVLLRHIVALGIDLGYSLVVEGVERQTQLSLLNEVDHLLVQGFYFYKPLSTYVADALLEETYKSGTLKRISDTKAPLKPAS
ncbi:MAG: EAL domain-containing protein [Betaproteobacteria bacterium]|nr:EAL domain-containing protein [Betaproteobacteria bacterium]